MLKRTGHRLFILSVRKEYLKAKIFSILFLITDYGFVRTDVVGNIINYPCRISILHLFHCH